MSIKLKARIVKEVYHRDNFFILSAIPTDSNRDIVLNKWGNFSIVGNVGYLSVDSEYELILNDGKAGKYGMSYEVEDCPTLTKQQLDSWSYDDKFNVMKQATTSDRLAKNILTAYPNFINDVVTKTDDELKDIIDLKNIKGVGEAYYSAYKRILRERFQYFVFTNRDALKPYQLNSDDAKAILGVYPQAPEAEKAVLDNPYYVLTMLCGHSFFATDSLLKEIRPDLIDSDERCEAVIIDILKKNEQDGNTRLNGNTMFHVMRSEMYNCGQFASRVVDVCDKSKYIYFDKESKDLSVLETYMKEVNVASFFRALNNNNKVLEDLDIEKYRTLDNGVTLTDEQLKAVENFKNHNVVLIQGCAGCVDKDTEYFNGIEWKKISDYTNGEQVLQYDTNTKTASLTSPIKYIKEPCNKMYHFETKYGLDQTLSPEHIVLLEHISSKTHNHKFITMTAEELKYNQEHNLFNSNLNKFPTTFYYDGKGIDLTDDEIKIMCAVICDGSFDTNRPNCMKCRFHIKKDRKKEALRNLFTKANIWWEEKTSSTEGYSDFYINAPRREKEFMSYWYGCNHHQLEVICENILQWDGHISYTNNGTKRKRFSTCVKHTADFIQFAFTACGYRSTISINNRRGKTYMTNKKIYKRKSIEYTVIFTERILPSLATVKDKHTTPTEIKTVVPVDGYKYCFQVPTEHLVLRRNNRIFVTHNCGKSTSTKAIVDACKDLNLTITALAPTGCAAMRLSECINMKATTIHLKCFRDKEINSNVVIVDESSMIDLEVFDMLIKAIKNNNIRIVLIGDTYQLTPVGIGTPFADLVNSEKFCVTYLTKVFRYGNSGIAYAGENARQGKNFLTDDIVKHTDADYSIMDDWKFLVRDGANDNDDDNELDDITLEALNQYKKMLAKGVKKQDILGATPFRASVYKLNNMIQAEFNPSNGNDLYLERKYGRSKKIIFRVGDRVINKKNNYQQLTWEGYKQIKDSGDVLGKTEAETTVVYNGQRGDVVDIVCDDKGKADMLVVKFENELVVYDKLDLYNLELSYFSTYHSLQGQESPNVIAIVPDSNSAIMTKNLLYVGGTRAKKNHIYIGSPQAYINALKIDGVEMRNTWLLDLINN
jgi:hypothetical protein